MITQSEQFSSIVEKIYNLPLEEKEVIKNLLEHNIADTRRNEITINFKMTQEDYKAGKLKFNSKIDELKQKL